jgi:hypothetical protein
MAGNSTERPEELLYVERVNNSHLFRDSEVSRRLLTFLAEQSLQHPTVPSKEHEIAESVFGLSSDFDPRLDSRVRVQVKRLREKLLKYYEESGVEDKIVLQIPAGGYHLSFLYRDHSAAPALTPPVTPAAARRGFWSERLVWAAATAFVTVLVMFLIRTLAGGSAPDPVLKSFWRPFLASPTPPLVIYGNSQYYDVGGVLRGAGEIGDGTPTNDSFTGVGEVVAAAEITALFDRFGSHLGFRRALNVSWDEAKDRNLIFVGAFSTAIKALPTPDKFAMQTLIPQPPGEVRTRIVDLRPGPGQPSYFTASPAPCCRVTTQDHALITFSPALSPKRFTLLVAGATTLGTQEAIAFLCRPASVQKLLSKLPEATGHPPYFEAVIRVRISGGAPVSSDIAAVHVRPQTP